MGPVGPPGLGKEGPMGPKVSTHFTTAFLTYFNVLLDRHLQLYFSVYNNLPLMINGFAIWLNLIESLQWKVSPGSLGGRLCVSA